MTKLFALYRPADDSPEFDRHFDTVHLPLLQRLPGLRKLEVTRVTGAPIGRAKYHAVVELLFESRDDMDAALASAEGKAVTRDIMGFAAELITVFHGTVEP